MTKAECKRDATPVYLHLFAQTYQYQIQIQIQYQEVK